MGAYALGRTSAFNEGRAVGQFEQEQQQAAYFNNLRHHHASSLLPSPLLNHHRHNHYLDAAGALINGGAATAAAATGAALSGLGDLATLGEKVAAAKAAAATGAVALPAMAAAAGLEAASEVPAAAATAANLMSGGGFGAHTGGLMTDRLAGAGTLAATTAAAATATSGLGAGSGLLESGLGGPATAAAAFGAANGYRLGQAAASSSATGAQYRGFAPFAGVGSMTNPLKSDLNERFATREAQLAGQWANLANWNANSNNIRAAITGQVGDTMRAHVSDVKAATANAMADVAQSNAVVEQTANTFKQVGQLAGQATLAGAAAGLAGDVARMGVASGSGPATIPGTLSAVGPAMIATDALANAAKDYAIAGNEMTRNTANNAANAALAGHAYRAAKLASARDSVNVAGTINNAATISDAAIATHNAASKAEDALLGSEVAVDTAGTVFDSDGAFIPDVKYSLLRSLPYGRMSIRNILPRPLTVPSALLPDIWLNGKPINYGLSPITNYGGLYGFGNQFTAGSGLNPGWPLPAGPIGPGPWSPGYLAGLAGVPAFGLPAAALAAGAELATGAAAATATGGLGIWPFGGINPGLIPSLGLPAWPMPGVAAAGLPWPVADGLAINPAVAAASGLPWALNAEAAVTGAANMAAFPLAAAQQLTSGDLSAMASISNTLSGAVNTGQGANNLLLTSSSSDSALLPTSSAATTYPIGSALVIEPRDSYFQDYLDDASSRQNYNDPGDNNSLKNINAARLGSFAPLGFTPIINNPPFQSPPLINPLASIGPIAAAPLAVSPFSLLAAKSILSPFNPLNAFNPLNPLSPINPANPLNPLSPVNPINAGL